MKNLMFSLAFMLIGSFAFANNIDNSNEVSSHKVINYEINGVNYSPLEFDKLNKLLIVDPCTITVEVKVTINGITQTFTETKTFEASWWGCFEQKLVLF